MRAGEPASATWNNHQLARRRVPFLGNSFPLTSRACCEPAREDGACGVPGDRSWVGCLTRGRSHTHTGEKQASLQLQEQAQRLTVEKKSTADLVESQVARISKM